MTQGIKKIILDEAKLLDKGLESVFVAGYCNGGLLAQQLMFYTDLKIGGYFLHRTTPVIPTNMKVESTSCIPKEKQSDV